MSPSDHSGLSTRLATWWREIGWAVLVSLSVLAAFLLWRRLVSDVPALLAASTLTLALDEPSKCNELLALAVLVPWLLATFAPPPGRRRLNPVVAGVVAGLMVPWYPNLLMLSLLGVAAIMVWRWWGEDDRPAARGRYGCGGLRGGVLVHRAAGCDLRPR